MVDEFYALVNNANAKHQGDVCWLWLVNPFCKFSVKSTCIALHNLRFGSHVIEVFKSLCQIKIPHKVFFLVW